MIAAHYRLTGPHAKPMLAEPMIRATPTPLLEIDDPAASSSAPECVARPAGRAGDVWR